MTEPAPPAVLQRLLAEEWRRRNWPLSAGLLQSLVDAVAAQDPVQPEIAAGAVPRGWLLQQSTDRATVARAIERALTGYHPAAPEVPPATVTFDQRDQRVYTINAGRDISGNVITGDGAHIVQLDGTSTRDDILEAVRDLVRGALATTLAVDEATRLSELVASRADITVTDVAEITAEVVRSEAPPAGRVRELLDKVAAGAMGGALATGLTAGATAAANLF